MLDVFSSLGVLSFAVDLELVWVVFFVSTMFLIVACLMFGVLKFDVWV